MEKLSRVRISAEWERALVACLEKPPLRTSGRRRVWGVAVAFVLAGVAGVAVWLARQA